jgi:MbtH protein
MTVDSAPIYRLVVNDEEQYSIWPDGKDFPLAWRATGVNGTREVCVVHIAEVWTDRRPRSRREQMVAAASRQAL